MPRPTKLLPGQEVTVAAFNAEIDRTRKQLVGSVGSMTQSGTTGGGLTPMRALQPLWGRLTDTGPDRSPDQYQWEEVYPDGRGHWVARTGDADTQLAPNDSMVLTDAYAVEWLINPAVEVNDRKVPIGTVVRLYPTENFVEPDKGLVDEDDDYWMHRHWLFHFDPGLRPFVLTEDLIPARAETGNAFPIHTLAVDARWLDETRDAVTLYACHQAGWEVSESFISLGFGRGASTYFRGTYGWARYTPHGTQIGVDEDGPVWRGEWQIVTLYAETIAEATVSETTHIVAGGTGHCNLHWIDKHQFEEEVEDSLYDIVVFNNLQMPLDEDDRVRVYYNRNRAIWVTLGPPLPSFVSCYASATVQTGGIGADTVDVQVPLDTKIFADENPAGNEFHAVTNGHTGHSLELNAAGDGVKNIGDTDLVVDVSWSVTAQRVIVAGDGDIDSYCQVRLKNNGVTVGGVSKRITSSRRVVVGDGAKAVNSAGNSTRQLLKSGELLTLWIHKNLSQAGDPNDWITVPSMCSMTVQTVDGVVFEETP